MGGYAIGVSADDVITIMRDPDAPVQPEDDKDKLRIFDHITATQNPIKVDFTLLGLNAGMWAYERGARTERLYTDSEGNVVVRDAYSYTYEDGGKDLRWVKEVERKIEWFTKSDEVGLTKDITPNFNNKKMKQLNRDLRQGRIDYLEASAEELREVALMVPEPYKTQYNSIAGSIDGLFNHYADQVLKYISRGTSHFEDDVSNETNANILGVFQIPSAPPSEKFPNGMTVRESILYQLTGEKP